MRDAPTSVARARRFGAALLALASACGRPGSDAGQPADASADAPSDAQVEVFDASPTDSPMDSAPDATVDVRTVETAADGDAPRLDAPVERDVASDAPPVDAPPSDAPPGVLPRLRSPMSTSTVTSTRPTLRWSWSGAPTSGAVVEVCSARDCAIVEQSGPATGTAHTLAMPLSRGVHFWRVRAGGASTPVWELFVRRRAGGSVDTAWGAAPDMNGDGRPEVFIAANHSHGQLGRVDVYAGAAGLTSPPRPYALIGGEPNGHFGWWVSPAGDVNGDGFGDVAIGAPDVGSNEGIAYVFPGSAAGLTATSLPTPIRGVPGENVGVVVAGLGDVDGDGYGDVAVGAPNAAITAGEVRIHRGSPRGASLVDLWVLESPDGPGASFGTSLASAGDINGDGFADLLVGAPGAAGGVGRAYLYLGSATGPSPRPALTLGGPGNTGSGFGNALGLVGDVNGDGYADFAVGAPFIGGGELYVWTGGPGMQARATWTLAGPGGRLGNFGFAVAPAGDINGDGFDDLLTSAHCAEFFVDTTVDGGYPHCGTGKVYVYNGSASGLSAAPSTTIDGLAGPDEPHFGFSVYGAGDVDGDGFDDAIVGAPSANMFSGSAYLFSGGATGLRATPTWNIQGRATSGENLGWSVALLGVRRRPQG